MQVIATSRGFDGHTLREPGDEFEMPDKAKGTWFVPVAKPPKPRAEKPEGDKIPA